MRRVLYNPLNGRLTAGAPGAPSPDESAFSYDDAKPQKDSNYWSATENNTNNAWNVNFNSGNVNNKNNTNNVVRPVSAYDGLDSDFLMSVWEAYRDCMRGKMTSKQALEYMPLADADLPCLAQEMWTGVYKPSTSTCFLVKYPKLREVFAANFRDRIVHHWICLRLEPLFEERFISQGNVSFNCRKGFGTDAAVRRVADDMYRVSHGYRQEAWIFKGDLSGFFMSIDKGLLWYLLERFIRRRYHGTYKDILLRTTQTVAMHHPEENCLLNSPVGMWLGLSPNKSLFTCGKEKGGPIGNLTTQQFVNFLMSFFDADVERLFRGTEYGYARFVDDWVIVCADKERLLAAIPQMEAFLREKLKLEMHRKKRYLQPVSHGISFVGTVIKPGRAYLAQRTRARMEERAAGFARLIGSGKELTPMDCQRIEQVMNSYLGFCRRRRTYRMRKAVIESMGEGFWRYFYVRGKYESIRARKPYRLMTVL